MRSESPEPFEARAWVDTGPVQERVYAQYAGIGWIGKNSCVINPEIGSWIFLGEIVCSLALAVDAPAFDQCGSCALCIEACPTQALLGPGVLDSNRCLSYLTIEQRGPIPDEFVGALGSRVYGCDVCQEVCPWNHSAPASDDPAWQPRGIWSGIDVAALSEKSDDELREGLRRSSMSRTKLAGLRRNLLAAMASTGTK
jgi:epoxyqueuosine reductase